MPMMVKWRAHKSNGESLELLQPPCYGMLGAGFVKGIIVLGRRVSFERMLDAAARIC
jgi:hypothetical protein